MLFWTRRLCQIRERSWALFAGKHICFIFFYFLSWNPLSICVAPNMLKLSPRDSNLHYHCGLACFKQVELGPHFCTKTPCRKPMKVVSLICMLQEKFQDTISHLLAASGPMSDGVVRDKEQQSMRKVANINYHLGLSYTNTDENDKAVIWLSKAIRGWVHYCMLLLFLQI